MKWKTRYKQRDPRWVTRFLFFPCPASDGNTYWLTFVRFKQTFYDAMESGWLTDYTTLTPIPPDHGGDCSTG
jgi:hypothetical protein